ncbi:thioesterase, partial [Pseudomonas aeruginosa]
MSPTSLEQLVRDARRNNDYSPLVELIPYAKLLGIECLRLGDDMVFRLPANKDNIG